MGVGGLGHSFLDAGGGTPCRERTMQGWVHPSGGGLRRRKQSLGVHVQQQEPAGQRDWVGLQSWEGWLSSRSQGDEHGPPEVRPWAGPWRVGSAQSGWGPWVVPRAWRLGRAGVSWPPMRPVGWNWTGGGDICCLAWGQLEVAFP